MEKNLYLSIGNLSIKLFSDNHIKEFLFFVKEIKDRSAKPFQPDQLLSWKWNVETNEVEPYTNIMADVRDVIKKLGRVEDV